MPKRKVHSGKVRSGKRSKKNSDHNKYKKLYKSLLRQISSSSSESESECSLTSDSSSISDVEAEPVVPEPPVENPVENENFNDLLGLNPDEEKATGPPLKEQIWTRWSSYISKGIEKDSLKEIQEKILIPSNASLLQAPQVNPEVLALMSLEQKSTDTYLAKVQTTLGKGLAGLLQILGQTIDLPDRSEDTKLLADIAKLVAASFHGLTTHRRFLLSSKLVPSARKVAQDCSADTLLFGNTFQEKCRAAKEIEKSSKELKIPEKQLPSSSLNFKRPQFKQRKKDPVKDKVHWKKKGSTPDRNRDRGHRHRRPFQRP
ncbi:hypothetical protein NQ315_004526 [Exocentrus adspersus]|uniref:Uncharacterized protein n=1 Tax=Exocentrus adspersus TaxID=1586481 RepID=A0AAV8V7N6_9CUCU|nr:hypothetical protein NQ315_004526 [Exocentrus adspersus]